MNTVASLESSAWIKSFPGYFPAYKDKHGLLHNFLPGKLQGPLSGGTGPYKPSSKKHEFLFPWKLVILLWDIFMDLSL